MFLPHTFFALANPKIKPLFDPEKSVWSVLPLLHDYLKTLNLGTIDTDIPAGAFLVDSHLISIGKGSVVEPGAYIRGPCVIGENCTVRHGAYIRGDLLAGNGCVIGHDTEVKNAVFFDNAHAAHLSYIGDSILGSGVNMGAGSICSNLKLDNSTVTIFVEGERINTGLRKFGAIIGDESKIGCNAVMNPGTVMGKNVQCYPCINVGGYVPSESIVKSQQKYVIVPKKQS